MDIRLIHKALFANKYSLSIMGQAVLEVLEALAELEEEIT
jgi:hypothetical protein